MFIFIVLSFSQSMELIGGNEIKLPPLKKENMSYVFPNKVSSYGILVNYILVGNTFLWYMKHEKQNKIAQTAGHEIRYCLFSCFCILKAQAILV